MKKTALLTAIALLASFAPGYADQSTMTYDEARAQAATLGKPLLVDFFTSW